VDVTLNLDQVRITTEDVIPAPIQRNQIATGVVIRERETLRDTVAPLMRETAAGSAGTSQRETEYSVGRRVEQVISQPGSIKRMQVVAVVGKSLDAAQLNQLRTVIGAAVGVVHERGDTVVVQSLENIAGIPAGPASASNHALEPPLAPDMPAPALQNGKTAEALPWSAPTNPVLLALAILILIGGYMLRGHVGHGDRQANRPPALSIAERETALAQIVSWTEAGSPGKRS
jgi:flagellar M-ring protein FliF